MNRLQRSSVNMLSSMAGYAVPMLVNLMTTPLLLHMLGPAGYGLQSLVGVIIGYLIFMDMGLDLPITKLLAEDRARQDANSENSLLSITLQLYAAIGLIGMIVIMVMADWLARSVFQIPEDLVGPSRDCFPLGGHRVLGQRGNVLGTRGGDGVAKV